jgi:hypothetical protein
MSPIFSMTIRRTALSAVLASTLAILSNVAHAGVVVGATGVSATAGLPAGYNAPTALSNIIDQSGLSANYVSGVTDFATFTSTTTACYLCTPGGSAFSELGGVAAVNGTFGDIVFDLGTIKTVGGIAVWNQAGSASLNTFDLLANGSVIGSFTMAANSQNFPMPASVFSFGPVTSQFVTMRITSNFGYTDGTIMNEVAFDATGTPPVPEPEGYALALSGLAVLGLVSRRARKSADRV